MANLLAGKLAVVTGGGSGIGRAICMKFAKQGAVVVVADVHKDGAESTRVLLEQITPNAGHASVACDVSSSSEVNKLRDFALDHFKRAPEIVVNCAGITLDATLLKLTEENFDKVIDVNLKGVFLVTQAFAKAAVEHKTPQSVINISSIVGKIGNFGQSNYAASKAGVIGFTKTVARELAAKGVRVNAVLPGFISTPMTGKIPEKVLAGICQQIPMGRMGQPEEIADAAVFLSSDLSSYVTGTTIEVTGGMGM
uniref:(3R)-3-hydroxyacyl-CoA dehydrogenase n=1 Tax=Plectus sambesii TaxID=2011161 RepID=A0A914WRS1_9BILA